MAKGEKAKGEKKKRKFNIFKRHTKKIGKDLQVGYAPMLDDEKGQLQGQVWINHPNKDGMKGFIANIPFKDAKEANKLYNRLKTKKVFNEVVAKLNPEYAIVDEIEQMRAKEAIKKKKK